MDHTRLQIVTRLKPAKCLPAEQELTLGDILFRLAIISPRDYRAIEVLARDAFRRRWPPNGDEVFLTTTKLSR